MEWGFPYHPTHGGLSGFLSGTHSSLLITVHVRHTTTARTTFWGRWLLIAHHLFKPCRTAHLSVSDLAHGWPPFLSFGEAIDALSQATHCLLLSTKELARYSFQGLSLVITGRFGLSTSTSYESTFEFLTCRTQYFKMSESISLSHSPLRARALWSSSNQIGCDGLNIAYCGLTLLCLVISAGRFIYRFVRLTQSYRSRHRFSQLLICVGAFFFTLWLWWVYSRFSYCCLLRPSPQNSWRSNICSFHTERIAFDVFVPYVSSAVHFDPISLRFWVLYICPPFDDLFPSSWVLFVKCARRLPDAQCVFTTTPLFGRLMCYLSRFCFKFCLVSCCLSE